MLTKHRELNGVYIKRHPAGCLAHVNPDGSTGLNAEPEIAVHIEPSEFIRNDGVLFGAVVEREPVDADLDDPEVAAVLGEALAHATARALRSEATAVAIAGRIEAANAAKARAEEHAGELLQQLQAAQARIAELVAAATPPTTDGQQDGGAP